MKHPRLHMLHLLLPKRGLSDRNFLAIIRRIFAFAGIALLGRAGVASAYLRRLA